MCIRREQISPSGYGLEYRSSCRQFVSWQLGKRMGIMSVPILG